MKELSVQQYTFRPWANQEGLFPVLEKLSKMGYTSLEMCCFGGFEPLALSPRELKARLGDLGMHMIGNHFTREMFTGDHRAAFDYIAEAGGRYAIYNVWGRYDTLADVREKADYLSELSLIAQNAGITLLYHNHTHEFATLEGKLVIDHLDRELSPDVGFEHDVFFSTLQGCDAYTYLRNNPHRVRAVHLKQIDDKGENVDLPDGILDMAQVIRCAESATDFILEQSSFREGIPQSMVRNAEFMKSL